MSSLKENKTCELLEQYLTYLTVVKGRSLLTADEYRIDNLLFMEYVKHIRGVEQESIVKRDFSDVDIDFIKSITVADMYSFITYCGTERKVTVSTRARKIVSIRQFWKRMPKYLTLDESIRLLILNTTQIYTHVDDEQLQKAVNSNPLAEMFGRGG